MSGIESPQNTFIIRFWWELPKGGPSHTRRWRGRIEHLQSGEVIAFCDIAQILAFIQNVVPALDSTQTDKEEDELMT